MRSPLELEDLLRAAGRKVTPQRQLIFRILWGNQAHPTAEAVHEAALAEMPTMSLRTVYSTLHDLADLGEVEMLDLGTGATRFDPNDQPHHHAVCRRCGSVHDLAPAEAAQAAAPALPGGFSVEGVEITFRGTCARCAGAAPDTG